MKMKEQFSELGGPITKTIVMMAAAWGIPELIEAADLIMGVLKGVMSLVLLGVTIVYWRVKIRSIEKEGKDED